MQTLTREALKQKLDAREPMYLINVLEADAFRQARIPGSYNIPLASKNFTGEVEQLVGDKNTKIVVYCASFSCTASPTAAKRLSQAGFTQVMDFAGGLQDWQEAGLPVERERQQYYA